MQMQTLRNTSCESEQPRLESNTPHLRPRKLLLSFSGKRAAGKDFVGGVARAELERGVTGCKTLRLAFSDQCKREFAMVRGLDFERLMHDREYKEIHRAEMTAFYERCVAIDPNHFIHGLLNEAKAFLDGCGDSPAVVCVTDNRLVAECDELRKRCGDIGADQCLFVRVSASTDARLERGWRPDPVKDLHFPSLDWTTLHSTCISITVPPSPTRRGRLRSRSNRSCPHGSDAGVRACTFITCAASMLAHMRAWGRWVSSSRPFHLSSVGSK